MAPGNVSAVELDYGFGRFGRVPSSLRVLGLVGDEWLDLTEEPTGAHLRARAANQLLRQRTARLVVRLRPGRVSRLRLVSADVPWDLPEVRVRVSSGRPSEPPPHFTVNTRSSWSFHGPQLAGHRPPEVPHLGADHLERTRGQRVLGRQRLERLAAWARRVATWNHDGAEAFAAAKRSSQ